MDDREKETGGSEEPPEEHVNPERQGPGKPDGPPADEPAPEDPGQEPPPDAIPGDSGQVPNPQQR